MNAVCEDTRANALPSLAEIETAARVAYRELQARPQYRWCLSSQRLGTDCRIKHENHTPVGAFKIRSGVTYFDALKQRGALPAEVVSATRGNHGQSLDGSGPCPRCGLHPRGSVGELARRK